jgi:hypothetical protein
MNSLWIVMRLELKLLFRGRVIWVIACAMALLGIWEATGIRQIPWGILQSWVIVSGFLVSLILIFATGEWAHRDQESHVDKIIWSTPVSTGTYVWGKYLSMLAAALGFTLVYLLAAMLADQFFNLPFQLPVFGQVAYPPLGPEAYLIFWTWFVLVPIVFGVALAFAVTIITRGQRIIAYVLVLLLWFASIAGALPGILDISTNGLIGNAQGSHTFAVFQLASQAGPHPSQTVTKRVMDLIHADIPPTFLPWSFFENRVLFFCLAILLIWLTVGMVSHSRKTAA